jgi:D-serine deaminase-like pyridoxal phosphate-dependent protein
MGMDVYRPVPGTRIEDLDTPCLLIDLDALEHNFRLVAATYRDSHCKMRAHIKNLKSPILAHMQIRAGGTVGGVCAAKVSEAEVMMEGGIDDIFIANQVVARDKIEVDTSMHRAGVRQSSQGVDLAKLATTLPGVAFKGVMSHQTVPGRPNKETRLIEGRRYIQMCLDVKDAIEAAGIPVEVVSTGESWTYDVAKDIPGVTEVEGGTYALMSHSYDYMREFQIAAKILGTIISTPRPGVAIGDVGVRALGSPGGVLPQVEGMPGVSAEALHPERIVLRTDGTTPLRVGDKFLLSSGQQDIMVNRWDQYIAVRRGVVEVVWDIPARGCHQ